MVTLDFEKEKRNTTKVECFTELNKHRKLSEGKSQLNFYLRRQRPNAPVEDKDWIVVQSDCIL